MAINPEWIGKGKNRKYEALLNQKAELRGEEDLQNRNKIRLVGGNAINFKVESRQQNKVSIYIIRNLISYC